MSDFFSELYSKKVMDHFLHPRNVGVIKKADGVATVGNPVCGDVMKMYIKIKRVKNKEYIDDIKFQTLGCGAAIATSSMITVMVRGKELDKALKVSKSALIKALGGLPAAKIHCSVLAEDAFKLAVKNYQEKTNGG